MHRILHRRLMFSRSHEMIFWGKPCCVKYCGSTEGENLRTVRKTEIDDFTGSVVLSEEEAFGKF